MNKFELQSKFWFWWPILAFPVLLILVGGTVWFFWPEAELSDPVETVDVGFGSIEELTLIPAFRLAYLRANGGMENMEAIQSVRTNGIMESGGQGVPFFSIKRRPNQSFTTLKMPDYELSFVVNGDQVWQRLKVPGQAPRHELKTGTEAEAVGQMGDFFDPIMRVLLFNEGKIEELAPGVWEGQEVLKLDFSSDGDNIRGTAYVDILTMHPVARVEDFGDGRERKVLYSDYRTIGGMQEPFQVDTYLDDVLQSRVIIEKSQVNVGTVASLFQYPGDDDTSE